ncbi:MAG: YibE/F family protein [Clostridiaceae bacterium]
MVGKNIIKDTYNKYTVIAIISVILISIVSFYFISINQKYYDKTVAKITSVTQTKNKKQQIIAIVKNGQHKGEKIELENKATSTSAYDIEYKINDEIFVSIYEDDNENIQSSKIISFKRDKYMLYLASIFALLIILVGGLKGFRSLISVLINIASFFIVIEMMNRGYNSIVIILIASLLFVSFSLFIVSGINKKTVSAILGTITATFVSMLITAIVLYFTNSNGLGYQEIEYLPANSNLTIQQMFFIQLLIGSLGAIMDISISISSAIKEMYDKNPNIDRKILVKSSMEIGKDIMGTMSNTLVFAYISGSIPLILILLKNNSPIFFNISLEIIRALSGSIGIVLSIPITMYISVTLIKNRKMEEG